MAENVIWSPLAEKDFENILEYLNKNWGNSTSVKFINLIDYNLIQLLRNPTQFPIVNKKMKIRKCVATKHNTIFYQNSKKAIYILRIFDTRQDPRSLKF